MQIVPLQALLQESVRRDVLELLQRVNLQQNKFRDGRARATTLAGTLVRPCTDLGQLVLDGELVLRIDVGDEFPQRRLGLEEDRLAETGDLEMLELRQAAAGVRAQPRSQRRHSPVRLKFGWRYREGEKEKKSPELIAKETHLRRELLVP